jgi:hypothetical protein
LHVDQRRYTIAWIVFEDDAAEMQVLVGNGWVLKGIRTVPLEDHQSLQTHTSYHSAPRPM